MTILKAGRVDLDPVIYHLDPQAVTIIVKLSVSALHNEN